MSTLFTNNDLIDFCLETNFRNNSIKHLKHIRDISLHKHEVLINIKNNNISVIKSHPIQDNLRLNFYSAILSAALIGIDTEINCIFVLNTDDGIDEKEKYSRLCISCSTESNHIQIPDPHIFQYFNFQDTIRFEDKKDQALFIGSDTGKIQNDLTNQRIRFCKNLFNHPTVTAKISNFVHYNKDMLSDIGIDIEHIKHEFIPINNQLLYRYILNIDGNTCSWDRIPWGMASNSYLIMLESLYNECTWYYPYITYIKALEILSEEDIISTRYSYNSDTKLKQKCIAKSILNKNTHINYLTKALIKYNRIYHS